MTTSLTPERTEPAPTRPDFPRTAPMSAVPRPDASASGAKPATTSSTTKATGSTSRDLPLPASTGSATQLHRLAAMASLQDWVRRSSPVLMHEAVLAGENPTEVAAAARLSVAEAHLTWNTWATRRLASPTVGEPLPLRQYLRVHTAFAEALNED